MLKKLVVGALAAGLTFSSAGQVSAASISDFKVNKTGYGDVEKKEDMHHYTFSGTEDVEMRVNFTDSETDGDILKITVREDGNVLWSTTANVKDKAIKVKKGKQYKVSVGIAKANPDVKEFNGAQYSLLVHGNY
ncbi:hypothetical protein [Priestia taiwanensis]|uniref:Uncharacterized protein n=1 Tax=Priestia taiwanensis TaxID=1347902 RepID=A0A917AXL5_9BACI|nr:hypothetical protein [Priestia taiwanensis]MBM7364657.1 hypothetical protein [Priestia taiwanensis]GGE78571.1 hypothetical protein GCM10007140_30220 [Priestia taiwanensis]